MKCNAKVCFINNRYIIGDINLTKIYGAKLIRAYMKPLEELFSAETVEQLASIPEMKATKLKVSTVEKEIFDASVLKIPFSESVITIMELYNISSLFNSERYDMEVSVSESIVDSFVTNVSTELAKIENSRNKKTIDKIREICLYFGGSILETLHYALQNNIENTGLHNIYVDVWKYLNDISVKLAQFGDIEYINTDGRYSGSCVSLQDEAFEDLLIEIIRYFSDNDQRVYIHCADFRGKTAICISNYKNIKIEKENWETPTLGIGFNKMIRIVNLATRGQIAIQRISDSTKEHQAFLMLFDNVMRGRLCEESL